MANNQLHDTRSSQFVVSPLSLGVSAVAGVPPPSIPGSITLTGSGFGAIANPRPTAFDTFNDYDGLIAGNEIPAAGVNPYWGDTVDFSQAYELDDTITLGSRVFSAKCSGYKGKLKYPIARNDGPPADEHKLYYTWFLRLNENLNTPTQNSRGSTKLSRAWSNSSGNVDRISYIALAQGYHHYWESLPIEDPNQSKAMWPSEDPWITESEVGKWHRLELYIDTTPGSESETLWVDGKLESQLLGRGKDPTATALDKWLVNCIGLDGRQASDFTTTLRHWLAEFYQQPSLARVELSNNPIYDDSVTQRRFYQVCISRSDSGILIPEPFFGDLDTGQPIYAHVINSDGSVQNTPRVN